jgi:hypothetical protein
VIVAVLADAVGALVVAVEVVLVAETVTRGWFDGNGGC